MAGPRHCSARGVLIGVAHMHPLRLVDGLYIVGRLSAVARYFCVYVHAYARCIRPFHLKNMSLVGQMCPGIVPSLGEGVDQGGVYRHCTRRVWR